MLPGPRVAVALVAAPDFRQIGALRIGDPQIGDLLGARGDGDLSLALAARGEVGAHTEDLVTDLLGVGVEVEQDARSDILLGLDLAHQTQQDVLGFDVFADQGLVDRELEDIQGAPGEGDLSGNDRKARSATVFWHLLAETDDADHLSADALDGDVAAIEHARRDALLFAEQPEQEVLGPDVVVL